MGDCITNKTLYDALEGVHNPVRISLWVNISQTGTEGMWNEMKGRNEKEHFFSASSIPGTVLSSVHLLFVVGHIHGYFSLIA